MIKGTLRWSNWNWSNCRGNGRGRKEVCVKIVRGYMEISADARLTLGKFVQVFYLVSKSGEVERR